MCAAAVMVRVAVSCCLPGPGVPSETVTEAG